MTIRKIVSTTILAFFSVTSMAEPLQAGSRVGLGQDNAKEPPMIRNLRLSDPLVQQKYLNEPDMMRFLRATYSEACARGMLNNAAKQVKIDTRSTPQERETANALLESQRIWKMTSFEMEALMGKHYTKTANFCDCLMKEVSDSDMVSPKKGLEVISALSTNVQKACERIAVDKTAQQANEKLKKE